MARRSLLRPFILTVLVFGAVWLAVILRWRAANRVPNGVDVALYLVALPLALLLGFVLVRAGFRAVTRRRNRAGEAASTGGDDDAADAAGDPSLQWRLPVLAADALLPAGDGTAALAEAARAGQRAGLHAELRDQAGLPVFAAQVEAAATDDLEDSLPGPAQRWPEARKRALWLGHAVAERVLDEHFDNLQGAAPPDPAARARTQAPVLQLEWLLPAAWSDADRDLARDWLATQLAAQGWSTPALQVAALAVAGGVAALKHLDDLNRAVHADPAALPRLVVASDSCIDEATVAEWDATHRLHGARRPEGQVPGEGAAGLLCGVPARDEAGTADTTPESPAHERDGPDNDATAQPELPAVLAHLHRLAAGQRARPVDQPGRLESDVLAKLAGEELARAGLPPDAPGCLVSDTDVRASRMAEAMHLAAQALPDRDPVEALLGLGVANGDCGAALALAAVAVAVQQAVDSQQPALAFSHHDATLRAALLVSPPPPPDDPGDAASPA